MIDLKDLKEIVSNLDTKEQDYFLDVSLAEKNKQFVKVISSDNDASITIGKEWRENKTTEELSKDFFESMEKSKNCNILSLNHVKDPLYKDVQQKQLKQNVQQKIKEKKNKRKRK